MFLSSFMTHFNAGDILCSQRFHLSVERHDLLVAVTYYGS